MRVDGAGDARWVFVRAPRGRIIPMAVDAALWQGALKGLVPGRLPPALIDNGPRWWVVELANEAAVAGLAPELDAIAALTGATGAVGMAVFARCEDSAHQLLVRAFCPGDGIPEDPVTGSANAAIAAWLEHNDALPSRQYTASQGRQVGRDGKLRLEVDATGEVWVGGQTQTVVRGTLDW